jgi:hypothetical protein
MHLDDRVLALAVRVLVFVFFRLLFGAPGIFYLALGVSRRPL